jgi:hypothetical protein
MDLTDRSIRELIQELAGIEDLLRGQDRCECGDGRTAQSQCPRVRQRSILVELRRRRRRLDAGQVSATGMPVASPLTRT